MSLLAKLQADLQPAKTAGERTTIRTAPIAEQQIALQIAEYRSGKTK